MAETGSKSGENNKMISRTSLSLDLVQVKCLGSQMFLLALLWVFLALGECIAWLQRVVTHAMLLCVCNLSIFTNKINAQISRTYETFTVIKYSGKKSTNKMRTASLLGSLAFKFANNGPSIIAQVSRVAAEKSARSSGGGDTNKQKVGVRFVCRANQEKGDVAAFCLRREIGCGDKIENVKLANSRKHERRNLSGAACFCSL